MAVSAWGQVFIQATAPAEDPVRVGSLWIDISGTPTLKVCTGIAPYTYAAVGSGGGLSSGEDRVVEDGTTRTIEDLVSVVVAEYFAIEGSGILEIEGDGVLSIL